MTEFSIMCQVCGGKVYSYKQIVNYTFQADEVFQENESLHLSCGCAVDLPLWRINLDNGLCAVSNFAGIKFLEFIDKEMIGD